MRLLRGLLRLIDVGRGRQILGAEPLLNDLSGLGRRFLRDPRRIGPHVRDQSDRPSEPISMPSYSCCASVMVFFGVKCSLRAASCCRRLVMNGATGFRFFSFRSMDVTTKSFPWMALTTCWACSAFPIDSLLTVDAVELGFERRRILPGKQGGNRPILFRTKRLPLSLSLAHEPHGHRLHASHAEARGAPFSTSNWLP